MTAWHERRVLDQLWFPFDLDLESIKLIDAFHERVEALPVTLNRELSEALSWELGTHVKSSLDDLLELHTMGTVVHLINGWGNSVYQGHFFVESLEQFVKWHENGPSVPQERTATGDFHPWQSFAYCFMAGLTPTCPIARGVTLKDLAQNSCSLFTGDGVEFGHLLFALSHLADQDRPQSFYTPHDTIGFRELMLRAIDAHRFGHFLVCRKIHLTEGIVAASALCPGGDEYRGVATEFLQGQMDALIAFAALFDGIENASADLPNALVKLREQVTLNSLLENACYYAGHLLELICFACSFGYDVPTVVWSAASVTCNHLNSVIFGKLTSLNVMDNIGALSHYRRGLTMLLELEARDFNGRLVPSDLSRYAIDFDVSAVDVDSQYRQQQEHFHLHYATRVVNTDPDPMFPEVLSMLLLSLPTRFCRGGGGPNYRKINVLNWPSMLHYELLETNNGIFFELHVESPGFESSYQHICEAVAIRPGYLCEPGWEGGWRVRLALKREDSPEQWRSQVLDFIVHTESLVEQSCLGSVANSESNTLAPRPRSHPS